MKRYLSCLALGGMLALPAAAQADPPDTGPVLVAEVNGTPLYQRDVFPAGEFADAVPPEQFDRYRATRIDQAVDVELAAQAAEALGAGDDDAFRAHLAERQRLAAVAPSYRRAELLAKHLQLTTAAPGTAATPDSLPDAEVQAYIARHEGAPRMTGEAARVRLAAEKSTQAHVARLQLLLSQVPVQVNGRRVDPESLRRAVVYHVMPAGAPGAEEATTDPLWSAVTDLADLPPAPAAVAAETIAALSWQIGGFDFALGDLPAAREPTAPDTLSRELARRHGGLLFHIVATYVQAEAALAAGVDERPDFQAELAAVEAAQPSDAWLVREALATWLLAQQPFSRVDDIEVTEGEIDDHYARHQGAYVRLAAEADGQQAVRREVARTLRQRRADKLRRAFFDNLRAKARIRRP